MKKKALSLLLAGALLLGTCTGCGNPGEAASSGSAGDTAAQEDTSSVVVAMGPTSEPEAGFDPAFGWGAGEHVHEPLIQSTLTVTNTDLTIGYDLATDVAASEDGLTWTVTIRDDVSFTDGEPLTAADVAFTYNTVKASSSVNDFTMLDYAEATNDTTVVFHMTRAFSIWPYTMAVVGIVPEHAYDSATYGSNPIGSGRYVLKQWDRGQQVILEANPDYYGQAPAMERVTILFMEEDAAFLAAQAGQVDVAYTSATYSNESVEGYSLAAYQSVDNRGFNLPAVPAGGTNENGVAVGNDFTSDVRVRRALNIGVDRQEMIDNVLNGYGSPAYSVCDQMPWYNPASQVEYDPQGAAALLDEAGWLLGEDGVREKDGVKAELTLLYSNGDSIRQALAADFASQMEELGIACSIEGVGWDTAYDRALSTPLLWGPQPHGAVQHLPHHRGHRHRPVLPLLQRNGGQHYGRGPGLHRFGGVLSAVAAGPVGRGDRRHPRGGHPLGVAGEHRPPVLGPGRPPGGGAENPSPRPRLVLGEQRGPVVLGRSKGVTP